MFRIVLMGGPHDGTIHKTNLLPYEFAVRNPSAAYFRTGQQNNKGHHVYAFAGSW